MSNRGSIAKSLGIQTKRLAMTQFLGHWQSAFKGNGIAFAESRPYQSGDPQKRIDRKTSAKKGGELYVKEFEEERQLRFLCAIDCGDSMKQSYGGRHSKFSLSTGISSLFWYAGSQLGDQVGGLGFIDKCGQYFMPKQGMKSMLGFNASLGKIYGGDSSIQNLCKQLSGLRVKNTIIIICCDDLLEAKIPVLSGLAARNDVIVIHTFDTFEIGLDGVEDMKQGVFGMGKKSRYGFFGKKQKETYAKNFEEKRAQTERFIRQSGADYCLMTTEEDPLFALTKFFIRRKQYT